MAPLQQGRSAFKNCKQQFVEQLRKADKRIPESDLFDLVSDRREYPTGWKQSTGLFLRQLALPPPFRGTLFHKKTEIPEGVSQILGARDGTRTHTAKPHAPQTCLSTIPTLSRRCLNIIATGGWFVNRFFKNHWKIGKRLVIFDTV